MAMNLRSSMPLWVRVMRTVSLTAFAVPVLLLAALLTNVGGYRGGWAWTSMLFGVTVAVTAWFGWCEGAGRPAVVAVLGVAGVIFGLLLAEGSVYSAPRLKAELDRIKAPEGFIRVGDGRSSNGGCLGGCATLSRRWLVSGTLEAAQQRISAALAEAGFEVGPWEHRDQSGGYSDDRAGGRRGRVRVTVIARTPASGGNPLVPENHVLVAVTVASASG